MILYIDATAGVSGDRLLAACLDAGFPVSRLNAVVSRLPIPNPHLEFHRDRKRGGSLRLNWQAPLSRLPQAASTAFAQLRDSRLSPMVRHRSRRILKRLAQAEAAAHGCTVSEVRFHQLSHPDTLLDIVGFSAALDYFRVRRVVVSPILLGRRYQDHHHRWRRALGPAVRWLTRDWPCRVSSDSVEHTTPTGAAIVTALARPGVGHLRRVAAFGRGVRRHPSDFGAVQLWIGSDRLDHNT